MEALIWIVSFLVISIVNTFLGLVLGFRLGVLLLYVLWFFVAKELCEKWREYEYKKKNPPKSEKGDVYICQSCGSEAMENGKYCRICGAEIINAETENVDKSNFKRFRVIVFSGVTKEETKELKEIDISRFPEEKYADGDTYYAIEELREGKKVRIYYTKETWDEKRHYLIYGKKYK